jgi:hypothetical protein
MSENLYIQIRNGGPFEHPIPEWNMRLLFADFDVDNPPDGFEKFVRVPLREIGIYEIYEGSFYEKKNGVYTDVHYIRPMTEKEKRLKIENVKRNQPYKSWILKESTLTWHAPKPLPDEQNKYFWDESKLEWVLFPEN